MKLLHIILFFVIAATLSAISIYDIQFTENVGDGTYPSDYEDEIVSTGGIVTGIDSGNKIYIENSFGGEWNGLFIYDDAYSPEIGDSIQVTGEVTEYYGLTELVNLTSFEIISSNNQLPESEIVLCENAFEERYESVLIEIQDVNVSEELDQYSAWKITDSTEEITIYPDFLDMDNLNFPIIDSYNFDSIKGIIKYSYGDFRLNPRNIHDFDSAENNFILSSPELNISENEFTLPINIHLLGIEQNVENFSFTLNLPDEIEFLEYDTAGTLSENGELDYVQNNGNLTLNFNGNFDFAGFLGTLVKLNFEANESGSTEVTFSDIFFNGESINFYQNGSLNINFIDNSTIGDTITVIQKPLLNIPFIGTEGNDFSILCKSEEQINNWSAKISFENHTFDLPIENVDQEENFYTLTTEIPLTNLYEQFDLIVENEIECDTTKNAVKILNEFRDDYYFVHITDTHLPTHLFYEDPESLTDTSEVADFMEVINDINILNPEFVLLTGDLINEGELEDFQERRYFTKAQKVLEKINSPVYLVTGNHDVGGWTDTPPPQGTARRNWWKFFGWNWLEESSTFYPYHTQNYSFQYSNEHYIGLESYDNYDSFMYEIYGGESFTNSQINYLNNTLENIPTDDKKILFYHYDFSEELNLSSLSVDMALYGHIHSNEGNINEHPYNLATDNICDETSAFRVIDVNSGELQPNNTFYSTYPTDNLFVEYSTDNNGFADSVLAIVTNNFPKDFNNALIKFKMPLSSDFFEVIGGTLSQTVIGSDYKTCYVNFNLNSNETTEIIIKTSETSNDDNNINSSEFVSSFFPNPFTDKVNLRISSQKSNVYSVKLYNLKGQLVKDILTDKEINDSNYSKEIELPDSCASGIYFFKVESDNKTEIKKILKIK